MLEEKEISVTGTVEDNTQDYLAAIKELKENSVDRSEYDKLRAENKRLIDAVVNGQPGQEEQVVSKHTKEEIDDLRNELFNSPRELNNLEYITKAMELRDALMENGEPDPFLPVGKQISPTRDDIEGAEKVAQVYKECIEYADGDSEVFTNELMRRTRDVKLPRK
jgi:hypothetical protein